METPSHSLLEQSGIAVINALRDPHKNHHTLRRIEKNLGNNFLAMYKEDWNPVRYTSVAPEAIIRPVIRTSENMTFVRVPEGAATIAQADDMTGLTTQGLIYCTGFAGLLEPIDPHIDPKIYVLLAHITAFHPQDAVQAILEEISGKFRLKKAVVDGYAQENNTTVNTEASVKAYGSEIILVNKRFNDDTTGGLIVTSRGGTVLKNYVSSYPYNEGPYSVKTRWSWNKE